MKKSLMTVFTLAVMLILGGMAYGQSASDPGQDLQQGGAYGTAGQNMGQGAEKLSVIGTSLRTSSTIERPTAPSPR